MEHSNETIEKPDYKLEAMFGKDEKQVNGEWVLARYRAGETLDEMAYEFGVEPGTLRTWLRKAANSYQDYKQAVIDAKTARLNLENAELERLVCLNRKQTLSVLEDNPENMTIKDRCQIEKTFGDRLALAKGDVTDRSDHKVGGLTVILANDKELDSGCDS